MDISDSSIDVDPETVEVETLQRHLPREPAFKVAHPIRAKVNETCVWILKAAT